MNFIPQGFTQAFETLWPLLALVILLYFFVQRPQAQAKKKHQNFLNNLKKGAKIITIGGIYGTVTAVKKDSFVISIAEKVEIEIARDAASKYQDPSRNT